MGSPLMAPLWIWNENFQRGYYIYFLIGWSWWYKERYGEVTEKPREEDTRTEQEKWYDCCKWF
jgi:hypothetical protein